MNKGTVGFYYNHIKTNIDKVDKRKQDFLKLRKQFLNKYCQPLQQKINKLDEEIGYYNHLIQNQNQMIENQKEVSRLKDEIKEFSRTQRYFLEHLEQHQMKIIEITVENEVLNERIKSLKHEIVEIAKRKTDQVYQEMNFSERQLRNMGKNGSNYGLGNSKVSSLQGHENQHRLNNQTSQSTLKQILPPIFKVQKYYVAKQTSKIKENTKTRESFNNKNKKNLHKSFTVDVGMRDKKYQNNIATLMSNSGQSIMQLENNGNLKGYQDQKQKMTKKQEQLKQRFKKIVTEYNKFQLLFKQCFQKKKTHVQKSVSQLQSKLITNRERFLQICEAINLKDVKGRITFDQFEGLTGDEIMTLFISFPWIQKKMFKEFLQKRKSIVEIQKGKIL